MPINASPKEELLGALKSIVSVSRRTDIPRYYSSWFEKRLADGFCQWRNPYNGKISMQRLDKESVALFVFWSRSYASFFNSLEKISKMGVPFYGFFTITNYPAFYDPSNIDLLEAKRQFKALARNFGADAFFWRYDPILISESTDPSFHIENFKKICSVLEGSTRRCYISFVTWYPKVEKRIGVLLERWKLPREFAPISRAEKNLKIEIALKLSEVGRNYGVTLFSCCDEEISVGEVKRASCVNPENLPSMTIGQEFVISPTRSNCLCVRSVDIGAYDTCPSGCIYCYANNNIRLAKKNYLRHNPDSATLL